MEDNCKKCGVQETGSHLTFECPVNQDIWEKTIRGARTWEDLEDKEKIEKGKWKVATFFSKAVSSKGWD